MKRSPIIDFIRFFSFFVVVGGHFYPSWFASLTNSLVLRKTLLFIFLHGSCGLICFYTVSGYLITQLMVQNIADLSRVDLKSFYVRRFARIFPLLLMVVLVGYGLEHVVKFLDGNWQKYDPWRETTHFGRYFWLSLFSLNFNWYLVYQHDDGMQWKILWSLAVEEQFYLSYPLIVKLLGRRQRVLVFLTAVVLSGLIFMFGAITILKSNVEILNFASFGSFGTIAIGGILYFMNEKWESHIEKSNVIAPMLFFLGVSGGLYVFAGIPCDPVFHYVCFSSIMAISCALVILGGLHLPLFNSKIAQILSWPGKLSYGCYLWHPTIMFLMMPVLVALGHWEICLYLIVAVILFSFISYRFFEVPANRWIRVRFKIKPSTTA
jgi:peptidoglycan/LPS O-acetylase OafA/YrhL